MKKVLAIVVVIFGVGVGIRGCQRTTVGGVTFSVNAGKPYADYADLKARRVPADGFLMTSWDLDSDNTLDLSFYTHGKPEEKNLIDPTIKRVTYLTQNLNKQYPIHVVFYDGNPKVQMNGQPVGTGEVLREITLPLSQ